MNVKDLVRPLPGVRQASLLRQRLAYTDSACFWEQNYSQGQTSGTGPTAALAEGKSRFLNELVRQRAVSSVIEFGAGRQPAVAGGLPEPHGPRRVEDRDRALPDAGSPTTPAKSFFLYEGTCFTDRAGVFTADLAISLDVVYHLTEDSVFETYLRHLFAAGRRLVVVYSTNMERSGTPPHVRHRHFTPWVEANCPGWALSGVTRGPNTERARADFFVYERS